MSYYAPYENMIPGVFTLAGLNLGYPPAADMAGRYAYVTDWTNGPGFAVCDAVNWLPADDDSNLFAAPTARTLSLGTAYQALNPAYAAIITVNVTSTSSNSLLSAVQALQRGEMLIAPTAAGITGGTGNKVGLYENSQGGVLVVGVTITQTQGDQLITALPRGWYYGVRQTTGANMSISSAYDQAIG